MVLTLWKAQAHLMGILEGVSLEEKLQEGPAQALSWTNQDSISRINTLKSNLHDFCRFRTHPLTFMTFLGKKRIFFDGEKHWSARNKREEREEAESDADPLKN